MTKRILLTIDLGNSALAYGLFCGEKLAESGHFSSNDIPQFISILTRKWVSRYELKVIISSVVPVLCRKLLRSLSKKIRQQSIYVIGKDIKPKLRMRYDEDQLGSDRLVNVYGALVRHELPCLVIDFGTAITFDYISKRSIFEGGLIVPGVDISWKALQEHAALLPKMGNVGRAPSLIGRDTKSAMNSGLLNGFGALADGLIDRFRKLTTERLTVLATGGHSMRIAPYVKGLDSVDPFHTIRSLELMYRREVEARS